MGKITFDAIGMDGFLDSLKEFDADYDKRATEALLAGAEPILAKMQSNADAHVHTGKLRAALKIGRRVKTGSRKAVEIGVFNQDAPHAHLVEFGHGGPKPAPAHPFMEPAYIAAMDEAEARIREVLFGD